MTEEQVTRFIMTWLSGNDWIILDYDFPGGGTGRSFHIGANGTAKGAGRVIPDIVATKGKNVLVFENKGKDTYSDYDKIRKLSESAEFKVLLSAAYSDRKIEAVHFAIGFSGEAKHLSLAQQSGVGFIIQVSAETGRCQVIYENLMLPQIFG